MVEIEKDTAAKLNNSVGLFQEIIENLTDIIVKIQLDGKILYVSPQEEGICGYSPQELLNQKIHDYLHPDDLELMRTRVRTVIQEGGTQLSEEFRVRHKNGQYLIVLGKIKIIKPEESLQLVCVITDITEKKEAQKKLNESEEQYRLLAENIEDIVSIFDHKLRLIYINEGQQKISGFTKEEVMNKSGWDFIHPEDLSRMLELFQKTMKKGTGIAEYRIRRKDNTYVWLETRGHVIIGTDGEKKLVIASRQVDRRKKLEQKLKESEEMYRLISENANDLIIIENLNLEPDYINQQPLQDLLGYSNDELIGKNSFDFIHPDDRAPTEAAFQQAIREGQGSAELRIQHRQGHSLWFEAKGRTFINEQGEKKLIIISRDITQRKQVEARLAESEARYRLITENVKDLITVIDQDMGINYVNYQTHQNLIGSLIENAVLNATLEQIHPEDRSKLVQLVSDCFRTDEVKHATFRLQGPQGQYLWFETTGSAYIDEKGEKKLIAISRDITERQHLLDEIKVQNEELRKLDQLKDEFYADISHDLRTPLTIIKGFAELFLNAPNLEETQKEDLQIMLKNEMRLERLINEIVDYSRLKSGQVQLHEEPFCVSEIVHEIKNEFKSLIDPKELVFDEEFGPDMEIILDKNQIMKVLKNLISNAIKYSFIGGKICITSRIESGLWTFSIRDQGVGISKKDISHLFSRFTRLKPAENMNVEGIGIGLAICKKIMDLYHGTIWAESEGLNRGSTFSFQIHLNNH